MEQEKPLKAVLAGCGSMSRAWLEACRDTAGLQLVGLVDLNEAAAASRKDEFGLTEAITGSQLEEILDRTAPDLVFDCTIPEAHVGVTLTALRHGCHVLGEKPLAHSMEAARQAVQAAEDAERLYAVIQNRRYNRQIRRFRTFLAGGSLGPLTTLNSDFYIGAHFGGFRDRMEHVLLLDMAIHTFDMARYISGADPVSVYCKEWNPAGSWYDHPASAIAVFQMTGGIVYTYRGSWCSEGLNTSWDADWQIIGERGSACWDGIDAMRAQTVQESGGFRSTLQDVEIPLLPEGVESGKDGGHRGLIAEFVQCVRTGAVPETIARDNIKSLAMVFGAIESARRKCEVAIEVGIDELALA